MGNTKVICTVTGPTERSLAVQGGQGRQQTQGNGEKAEVVVNISVAGFSGVDRKRTGRGDKCVSSFLLNVTYAYIDRYLPGMLYVYVERQWKG